MVQTIRLTMPCAWRLEESLSPAQAFAIRCQASIGSLVFCPYDTIHSRRNVSLVRVSTCHYAAIDVP